MKFKVGDKVKFSKEIVGHTDSVKIGEIYKIIKIDESFIPYKVENGEWFTEEELELADYTYEDLKKSPIGTKVTFENKEVFVKDDEDTFENLSERLDLEDLEGLEDNHMYNGKIIKIEEPEYTTVYEYKPEILDEAEKRYLRGVIRPFRDDVEVIRKLSSRTKGKYYIQIRYKDEPSTNLPYFESQEMYKNMETEKIYTLEELGL